MIRAIKASASPKIPYTLVSMAAILRDHIDPEYKNTEHEQLTDIADSLYNVGRSMVDEFKAEYKELYDKYGADYFDKVIEDMRALDDQVTSDAKVEELLADYEDRLKGISASVKAATAVTASDYNPYLVKVSKATRKYILDELNRSSKVRDEFDNDSYKFEFMPTVSGTGVWASPNGLKILDEADIDYELVNPVKASGNPFYDKLSESGKRFARNTIKQMARESEVTPENICELAMKLLPAEDIDHHATDLYIRKTPESTKLINKMKNKSLLSTFIDNIDHVVWYELPFCYSPAWEERLKGRY